MTLKSSKYSFKIHSSEESGLSKIEEEILKSLDPIEIDGTEEISLLGQRGIFFKQFSLTKFSE